ncbi:GTPase-activating protein gyp8 [Basidiobolus ranarum]|uniref:GTPase-activating protein gyp8 n=1 Tax=Basidiobolus ranarum TaxID=34480 RepID=A0ABR2VSK8_9FUNG
MVRKKTLHRTHPRRSNRDKQQLRVGLINDAIRNKDIASLKMLATTGPGLLNDGLRRLSWPLILHCDKTQINPTESKPHKDESQVSLDVKRSLGKLPTADTRQTWRAEKRKDLTSVITQVLRNNPNLSYYQGFHDICTCLLLVLGPDKATEAAQNMALFFLRDAMSDSLEPVMSQLALMQTIIAQEDSEVNNFLLKSETPPYFCLSWVLTWCSHDFNDFSKVTRLFDFFLCVNPLAPVYFAASGVLSRKDELLECECEYAMGHTFLSKLPQEANVDVLITRSMDLLAKYPPNKLQTLAGLQLPVRSVVNTYNETWENLGFEDQPDIKHVRKILSKPLPPAQKRDPRQNYFGKNANRILAVLALSASVSTVAIAFLMKNELARNWMSSSL